MVFARHIESGEPVVIKTLGERRPSARRFASFRHELGILRKLDACCAASARELTFWKGRPYLVMDDVGGVALRELSLTRSKALTVGKAIVHALMELHRKRVIHKNINPEHIIVHPETFHVQLIDFTIASLLPKESQGLESPNALEGNLPYIAPEQTGRMNRTIDRRADLYSLGVTLYELFCGRLPFDASTPLEWVHCHIAKSPLPAREVCPDLPAGLSSVLMRLLEAAPEDRYQSGRGLLDDLIACEAIGDDPVRNEAFVPASQDRSSSFELSQKLYGRAEQLEKLLGAFAAVSGGDTALMLVAGYSGIGKTALISEIHKPIVARKGFFISGKFDQFKRDIPYASLIQAFAELVRQLLTEDEASLARWRERLWGSLDGNGQVLVDVIPDIAMIIGEQPPVARLEPAEAQIRFNEVFQRFVRSFAAAEHPLVIFVDDLQWADLASLKLLQLLCADSKNSHVLLIGAYRDNEVDAAHPLTTMVADLVQSEAHVETIHLEPLDKADVGELIADSMHCDPAATVELAALICDRTLGNPFFVGQCLRELHESELLRYDPDAARWTWDLEEISAIGISNNVVELMVGKIVRLPAATQKLLSLAACVGNRFDIETLSIVSARSVREVLHDLAPAVGRGLILPLQDSHKVLQRAGAELDESEERERVSCRFLHDRVQQAAYALISENDRTLVHLKIGRRLVRRDGTSTDEQLFEAANHLNAALKLIEDSRERSELAALNLRVGAKAKRSTAYESARGYLKAGIRALPRSGWQEEYALSFDLHEALSECAYLLGDFDGAETICELLLREARDRHDKSRVFNLRMAFYSSLGRFTESIEAGFTGLELYGIDFRSASQDLQGATDLALREIEAKLADRDPDELTALPRMSDAAVEDSMHLLMNLTTQAYIADQDWFPLIAMKMVSLSLEHGNCPASSFAYGYLGVIVGALRGNHQMGRRLCEMSIELNARFDDPALYCKLYWTHGALNNHWTRHISSNIALLRESVHYGHLSGDYVFGSWAYYYLIVSALLSGKPLADVADEADKALAFLEKINNRTYLNLTTIVRNLIRDLQGVTSSVGSFSYGEFDEEACISDLHRRSHGAGIARYNVMKMMVLYQHEHYEAACQMGHASEATLRHLTGQPLLAEHSFYYALSLCAQYPNVDRESQRVYRATVEEHLSNLRRWARSCPANFLHKQRFVEAELARVDGKLEVARVVYKEAIAGARAHGFVQNEALASVQAARLHDETGRSDEARTYMRRARDLYTQWGAQRCVEDIEGTYSRFFSARERTRGGDRAGLPSSESLDAATIVKATRAISSELNVGALLDKMVAIMVESAGAQTGYLFQDEGGRAVVKVRVHTDASRQHEPARYAQGVVNYVRRTGETVILRDASADPVFGADAHVASGESHSIVCMPMRRKDTIVGTLYFENSLRDAFTPARVDVLDILAAQAAVSLENATIHSELNRLNEGLEARVVARTEQLSRANREIGELNTFRESVLRSLPAALMVCDGRDRIISVNRTTLQLLGFAEVDLVGCDIELVLPDVRDRSVERMLDQGEAEAECLARDGTRIPVLLTRDTLEREIDCASGLRGQVYIAIDNRKRRAAEQAVKDLNQRLVRASRQAGMAEVAASVLHNVGNTLNSLNVAKTVARRKLQASRVDALVKLSNLLDAQDDPLAFMASDRGRQMPVMLRALSQRLEAEHRALDDELRQIGQHIDDIATIVSMQQKHTEARSLDVREVIEAKELLYMAEEMSRASYEDAEIELVLSVIDSEPVYADRHKVLQILLQLLENAHDALQEVSVAKRRVEIETRACNGALQIDITDNGGGISSEDLARIFNYGFTTKDERLGLGLHVGANAAGEMGGSLAASSEGKGRGATFTLTLPLYNVKAA